MKTLNIKTLYRILFCTFIITVMSNCTKDWLTPKPLSIFTHENAFIDVRGVYGALTACDKSLRSEFFQLRDRSGISDEMIYSDVAV